MKKKKLGNLSLNKTIITSFKTNSVVGGGIDPTRQYPCPIVSENGPCTSFACGPVTTATLDPTCAQGCTIPTLELSNCNGPCMSIQICA